MEQKLVPEAHRAFLEQAINVLKETPGIIGIAAGGSYVTGSMDEFSDLDLVVGVDNQNYERLLNERQSIAASLGNLLGAFTGEHVGEPRLLICLYDDPLLHVDLKFVKESDFSHRVEAPTILWEHGNSISNALEEGVAKYPAPDAQWIEDRFWIWIHYGVSKVGRGELFEAIDFLTFLRSQVLGPLALQNAGQRPSGVRRIEMLLPDFSSRLQDTLARHGTEECYRALTACVEIYRDLRHHSPELVVRDRAEKAATAYLAAIRGSKC
jgi:predicted nucleotidyltransferase